MKLSDFDLDPDHPNDPVRHPLQITWRGATIIGAILGVFLIACVVLSLKPWITEAERKAIQFATEQTAVLHFAKPFAADIIPIRDIHRDHYSQQNYEYWLVEKATGGFREFMNDPYMEIDLP